MKKKVLIIFGIGVAAIAIMLIINSFRKKDTTVTFDTVKVEQGTISNTVTATGTIEAITTVNVGTQVSGILQNVYVDFNDDVKKGQLLARLDETSLKAQLDQSQSQVDQAQAQLNFQEATFNRLKPLYEKKLIAQADYDQALYNYENSKASLNNAKSALARAKVNLEYATISSPIDGVVLNRAVEEGQTVAASFNTPTLFTIVNDLTQMEVQTSVDEADIGKVQQGQRVEFTVDAYSDMKFDGSVSQVRLQPVTTSNVVTYVVIINAPNPEKKLMPGMTASATIYIEERNNTLTLSGKAIRFIPDVEYMNKLLKDTINQRNMPFLDPGVPDGENSMQPDLPAGQMVSSLPHKGMSLPGISMDPKTRTVWLKDEKMVIRPCIIKIGIDNGSIVEILSGLEEGDEVIISMSTLGKELPVRATNNGPPGPFPF